MEITVCLRPNGSKWHPPATQLHLSAWTDTLPADGKSYVGISVNGHDAEGTPIADGERIYARTSNGTLTATHQLSKDGSADFYLYAPDSPGTATVEVSYGENHASLTIIFTDTDMAIMQGQVSDADAGKPLQNVQLQMEPNLTTATDAQGHFFITTDPASKVPFETTLHISKVGYYPDKHKVNITPNQATIVRSKLQPIAGGAFASTVIILDSRSDTPTTKKIDRNLERTIGTRRRKSL